MADQRTGYRRGKFRVKLRRDRVRPIAHNLVGIVGGRGQHRGPFRQTSHGLQMAQMRRKCGRQAAQQRIIDTHATA